MGKFIDLTGECFGRLTVVGRGPDYTYDKKRFVQWNCVCDCGNRITVRSCNLRSGHTTSCGCLQKEKTAVRNIENGIAGGKSGTRLYRIWKGMKDRTGNIKNKSYADYGGRGIEVCEEWRDNFSKFREWALESGYDGELTIERINCNKGYYPGNCKWITKKAQSRNKRNTVLITYKGTTKSLVEWAEENKMPRYVLRDRLKAGWSMKRALNTPYKKIK